MHKLKNFNTSTGRICLMSCLADIFNYYGLDVNESIIFTLSEASLFYYRHFDIDYETGGNEPLKLFALKMGGMRYDIPLMVSNVIQYFGVRTDTQSGFEISGIKEFITENINRQRPVLSLLSRKHLEYMDKAFRDDITHSINILGYDWDDNRLFISDTFIPAVPVKLYQGPLEFDNYYNSLVSSKDIFNKDFSFRNIVFSPEEGQPFSSAPVHMKLQPLKRIASNFLEGDCTGDGIRTGLSGYKQFIADFEGWLQEDITPQLLSLMRIVHHRLTNYGGPVITNQLLAEYTGHLGNEADNTEYSMLKEQFSDISRKWFVIANIFCKASLGKMEEVKHNLYQRLADVMRQEEDTYRKIAGI